MPNCDWHAAYRVSLHLEHYILFNFDYLSSLLEYYVVVQLSYMITKKHCHWFLVVISAPLWEMTSI